jgi:hypothetical protein
MKVYRNDALQATVVASPIDTLTASQIREMKFVQSLNTLILVHPDRQPIQVLRTNDTTWTPSLITLTDIPTYDFGSGAEAVWSSGRGWPRSAAFWNQRLWFGGSKSRPSTIWGSTIAGFFDFGVGTNPADAIEVTIDDDQVNAIENVFGGRTLQVFSQAAEYFSPVTLDQTVTPTTFKLERASRHGSSFPVPVSSDGATLFVDQAGRVVREYIFLDVEQSYISDDISFLSEHLIRQPVAMGLQKSQERLAGEYVYFVNGDGTIAVLNRRRSQSFIAWSLWETLGEYEDLAVVGNEIYVQTLREIDGSDVRFIEKFDFDYYTDAGTILTGTAETEWTGLTYLEGESVYVRSQENYPLLPNTVDSSGELVTESAQDGIEVGLPWTPQIRTLPPHSANSNMIGQRRRISSAFFNLKDSDGFTVTTQSGEEIRVSLPRFGDVVFDEVVPKFSGWKRVPIRGFSREPYIEITQPNPVDLELLSLTLEVTT